jgi:formylglycine-generating enzyme required for sulfatase activity
MTISRNDMAAHETAVTSGFNNGRALVRMAGTMKLGYLGLTLLMLCVTGPLAAAGEHRVALLIGQSDYRGAKLAPIAADLRRVSDALARQGFRCETHENLAADELGRTVERFVRAVPNRGVAVVYFAGIALAGNTKGKPDTFLQPVDATAKSGHEIGTQGYGVTALARALAEQSGALAATILVDASTVLPDARAEAVGLRAPEALPSAVQVIFPRAPGEDHPHPAAGGSPLAAAVVSQLADRQRHPLLSLSAAAPWKQGELPSTELRDGPPLTVIAPPEKMPLGTKAGDEWVSATGMVFVWCPAGTAQLTPPASDEPEQDQTTSPLRPQLIPYGFWISKYELTIRENLRGGPHVDVLGRTKLHPMARVHYDDGLRMVRQTMTNNARSAGWLPADWQFDLPTETEWEYAARAGSTTRWFFGDEPTALPRHGNFADRTLYATGDHYFEYSDRQLDDGEPAMAIIGSYAPNPWGLCDVYGNVAEWCVGKALRGGSYLSLATTCSSTSRVPWPERNDREFIGYRVVIRPVAHSR